MKKLLFIFLILTLNINIVKSQNTYQIAILKYNGGGDWYANPTALPNLITFSNENIGTNIKKEPATVEVGSNDIFNYPFLHMTGHGNVRFSEEEIIILREFLLRGSFLHADDNYGMDKSFRREMKRVFPNKDFVELPYDHPLFHSYYDFPNGLPKVHVHDGKDGQAFGLFNEDRLMVLYTYECDLGDGWEDEEVHKDPADIREKALQMGVNIIYFALTQ